MREKRLFQDSFAPIREKNEDKLLINFSVENFRSFGAEQTLNLIAAGKIQDHEEHYVPISNTGKNVLRTGVIYGANAAGKSNIVRAIHFAQSLIHDTNSFKKLALSQFRFWKKKTPSSFEFRFLVEEQIFVYGFAINQNEVVEEWLEATSNSGRSVEVFARKKQKITVGKLKPFGRDADASEQALNAFKVLEPRPNQLLLNKIVDLPSSSRGKLLDRVAWWFTECLTVVQADTSFGPLLEFLDQEAGFRRFAAEFLHSIGTGIVDLHIEQLKLSAEKLPKELLEGLQSPLGVETTLLLGNPGVSLQLDPNDPTQVIRRNLAAQHRIDQSTYSISFQEESDGTQRCLNLLPALFHLTTGTKVFVIDELDRSLHPLLSHAFLKFFIHSCPGACQQLIVTTHETHLLDQELLRRDEVWFVEKDSKQQTQLYSLADMKVRNDVRLEKGYLQGRFGGIPFIGDTKKLMDLIQCPTNGKPHAKKKSPS
jgi:AAA15 family ATPase/GTPase